MCSTPILTHYNSLNLLAIHIKQNWTFLNVYAFHQVNVHFHFSRFIIIQNNRTCTWSKMNENEANILYISRCISHQYISRCIFWFWWIVIVTLWCYISSNWEQELQLLYGNCSIIMLIDTDIAKAALFFCSSEYIKCLIKHNANQNTNQSLKIIKIRSI